MFKMRVLCIIVVLAAAALVDCRWSPVKQNEVNKWSPMKENTESQWPAIKENTESRRPPFKENAESRWPPLKQNTESRWPPLKENAENRWPPIKESTESRWPPKKDNVESKWPQEKENTESKWPSNNENEESKLISYNEKGDSKRPPIKEIFGGKWPPSKENVGYKLAEPCTPEKCVLPHCRCSTVHTSDSVSVKDTPQFVMLTFDDAVTALNHDYIKKAISPLVNPDGCPAQATFFVSHEYTDYSKVHSLWCEGHEIALHSISHTPSTKYWREASVETLVQEFGGQREMLAHFANMNIDDIQGIRLPLFQLSGNNSYIAMKQIGLTYDSSWPSQHFVEPGMWPYSLDYMSTQDCPLAHCPTASIPGIWVAPLLMWDDMLGHKCSMVDACIYPPEDDMESIFEWMKSNFLRHYNSNRAPFGIYLHSAWFLRGDHCFEAYAKFLKYLNSLPDVYISSVARVVEYTREPKPHKPFSQCQKLHSPKCRERFCQLQKVDTKQERWMKSCVPCPAVYPWVNNPMGKHMSVSKPNKNKKRPNA